MPDLRILKLQAQRQLKQSLALANQFFNKEFTIPVMHFELRGKKPVWHIYNKMKFA